ncbi:MAG: BamA/TamA family outer membrane protein [Burkholderiales bacterium]|nr:BamA/TamA family outer membrane protein [Bacteroidia bacterium]
METNKIYVSLINEGYISAAVDSIIHDSLNYKAYITAGQKYKWVYLRYPKKDQGIISKIGYNERFFSNRPFKYTEFSRFMEKIIVYYENNGYPFVSAKLDSLDFDEGIVKARLKIERNVFVKLDSLITEGSGKVSHKFLMRYLGVKNGMPYNAEVFSGISKKMRQLPFVTEKKPPIIQLTDKQNKLFLFLEKKNASQFDGIIGILPSDKGKTIFTGDLKIKLVNSILKSGETFDINWRRLQTQTQDLKAVVIYPYIGGLPVGADYNIKIYKKDSTFLDVNNALGLNYYFNGLNHIKVFYKQRNANLLSTSGLENIIVLPEYADVITKSYGLGFFLEKLDYRFNPRKGLSVSVQGSVGNRQIRKNPKIKDVAYSTIPLKSTQYQCEGVVALYVNLVKNHVLKLSTQFGSLFGNTIYKNELFRVGGLRTMRGFDEESIYASTYVIPTIEYRFLFEKNSNLFVFGEGAWYENGNVSGYTNDTPMSVGAGINFETKAGIFNLSYAIGKQYSNGFDLRIGKIHAGLTALF